MFLCIGGRALAVKTGVVCYSKPNITVRVRESVTLAVSCDLGKQLEIVSCMCAPLDATLDVQIVHWTEYSIMLSSPTSPVGYTGGGKENYATKRAFLNTVTQVRLRARIQYFFEYLVISVASFVAALSRTPRLKQLIEEFVVTGISADIKK